MSTAPMSRSARRALAVAAGGALIASGLSAVTAPAHADDGLRITSTKLNAGECGGFNVFVFSCHGIGVEFVDATPDKDSEYVVVAVSPGGKKVDGWAALYDDAGFGSVSSGLKNKVTYKVTVEQRKGKKVIATSAAVPVLNRRAKAPLIQRVAIREDLQGNAAVRAGTTLKVKNIGTWEKGLVHRSQVLVAADSAQPWDGRAKEKKSGKPTTVYAIPSSAAGKFVWLSTLGEGDQANSTRFGFGPIKVVGSGVKLKPVTKKSAVRSFGTKKGTVAVGKKVRISGARAKSQDTTITYQWFGEGGVIKGATKSSFTVKKKHKGQKLAVTVRATRRGHSATAKAFLFSAAK